MCTHRDIYILYSSISVSISSISTRQGWPEWSWWIVAGKARSTGQGQSIISRIHPITFYMKMEAIPLLAQIKSNLSYSEQRQPPSTHP